VPFEPIREAAQHDEVEKKRVQLSTDASLCGEIDGLL
jgi:hypothetical protein